MNGLDFGTAIGLIKGIGSPNPAVIEGAVSDWLDDHPEATTTVQDGSITKAKLDSNLQGTVDDVADLKSQMNASFNTAFTWTDGKYLNNNGVETNYAPFEASSYIPCFNDEFLFEVVCKVYINSSTYCFYYDANKNIIDKIAGEGSGSVVTVKSTDFSNVRFIRLSNKTEYTPSVVANAYNAGLNAVPYTKVEDVVVTKGQTDFIKRVYGTNLYNVNAEGQTIGKYFGTTGSLNTSASCDISDYTEVEPNTAYVRRYDNYIGGKSAYTQYFDANKTQIGSIEESTIVDNAKVTFTTPINCKYIKVNVMVANGSGNITKASYMIVKGSTLPSEFVPYSNPYYMLEGVRADESSLYANLNPLYGKKIAFDGDSICASNASDDTGNGWAGRIANKNAMTWHNYAVGGGTITAEVISTNHWIVDSLDTIYSEMSDLDYYIFEGGVNDADIFSHDDNARLGTVSATNFTGNYDDETFCGAMETIIFNAQQYFPQAKIGYIVAPKMGMTTDGYKDYTTINRKVYFDKAMEICKKWGIPFLNLWDECRMNPELRSQYVPPVDITGGTEVTPETIAYNIEHNKLYRDGQHPTAKGYDLITPMVEAWLKTL